MEPEPYIRLYNGSITSDPEWNICRRYSSHEHCDEIVVPWYVKYGSYPNHESIIVCRRHGPLSHPFSIQHLKMVGKYNRWFYEKEGVEAEINKFIPGWIPC